MDEKTWPFADSCTFQAAIEERGSIKEVLKSEREDGPVIDLLMMPYHGALSRMIEQGVEIEDAERCAASREFEKMFDVYLRYGGDPSIDPNGFSLLHSQLNDNPNDLIIEHLLKSGARPDVVESFSGESPLHFACATEWVAQSWLRRFLDVPHIDTNIRSMHPRSFDTYDSRLDEQGTPLHWVTTGAAALLLIQNGASVNALDRFQETPLFSGILVDYGVAEVLIEHGAWLNHHSVENETALSKLFQARKQEQPLVLVKVELLISHGADPNPTVGLNPKETLKERLMRTQSKYLDLIIDGS